MECVWQPVLAARLYKIDASGQIRYSHIGEGDYDTTEKVIRQLLVESNSSLSFGNMTISASTIPSSTNFNGIGTPEIYLGYSTQRQPLGNPEGLSFGSVVDYRNVSVSQPNTVYLYGQWNDSADRIISVNNSKIFLIYQAKSVNIVAGGNSAVSILLDGKPLASNYLGTDVAIVGGTAIVEVGRYQLYNLVSAPGYGTHVLELDAAPGLEVYTFTFG